MTQPATHATTTTSAPPRGNSYVGVSDQTRAKRLRANARHELDRIVKAAAAGKHDKAKNLQRRYLRSYAAMFVAAEEINKRRKRGRPLTLGQLLELAERLSAWHGTSEAIRVTARPKRNSEFRYTCAFGTENRTLQVLVRTALEAGASYDDAQFSVKGRGGPVAATQAINDAIATGLYKFAIKFDVRNCYPSLTAVGITSHLPVPRRVANAVVMVGNNNMTISYPDDTGGRVSALTGGPTGIWQGSLASSAIAHMVLKELLRHVPATAFKAMWVDDLIVLARNRAEAIAIRNALHAAALRLPTGPLRLTDGSVRRLCDGIEFLGRQFQRKKGKTTTEPSAKSKNKFTAKAREILSRPPSLEREQAYRSLARGFEAQHRIWPEAVEFTMVRRIVVEAHMRPNFKKWPKSYSCSCFMA
jgi:hypothetical protein